MFREVQTSMKPNTRFISSIFDANNLYGWAMTQKLPTGNFRFLSKDEIGVFNVFEISDDSETGYIIECDLKYPSNLHEEHSEYPLAPELWTIAEDMLPPYCQSFDQKHID